MAVGGINTKVKTAVGCPITQLPSFFIVKKEKGF